MKVVQETSKENCFYKRESGHFWWCLVWLAIANEVRTRIMTSGKNIFIPELNLQG